MNSARRLVAYLSLAVLGLASLACVAQFLVGASVASAEPAGTASTTISTDFSRRIFAAPMDSGGVTLTGTLVDTANEGLEGDYVRLTGPGGSFEATTVTGGEFTITLPAATYSFVVGGDRPANASAALVPDRFEFDGTVSLSENLSTRLTLPLHSLTVYTDGPSGDPVSGAVFQSHDVPPGEALEPGVNLASGFTAVSAAVETDVTETGGMASIPLPAWSHAFHHKTRLSVTAPPETELPTGETAHEGLRENESIGFQFHKSLTDPIPPEVQCPSPDSLWHLENLTFVCTAKDSGTGLAHAEDASFTLSTGVIQNQETATAYTASHRVCDKADNCSEAKVGPSKIDRKGPSIAITTPSEGATFEQFTAIKAQYSCSDGGSGVASCEGTVPSGAPVEAATLGKHSLTVTGTDAVGNTTTKAVNYTVIASKDHTPPEIRCEPADASWHASNVTLACTAVDSGSVLAHPVEEASFSLATTVPEDEETASAYTPSRHICDAVGNCGEVGPLGPIKVDQKPPSIEISSPQDAATVIQGTPLEAGYTCSDAGSGAASCDGTVPDGSTLETATLGRHELAVTATDEVGNATSRVVRYTVRAPTPVVTAVNPRYGRLGGGEAITISGEHLAEASAVSFGGLAALFDQVSSSEVVATSPKASAPGTVDVTVATSVPASEVTEVDQFTYVAPEGEPSIKKVSPNKGPASGGAMVTITGENLEGATHIMFGGQPGTQIVNLSKTEITAVTPAGTAETVLITLATPYGTTPAGKAALKYERPVITGLGQHSGPLAGGNTITVTGYGFKPGTNTTSFSFKKTASTLVECASSTNCTVLVPAATKAWTIDVVAAVGKAKSKKSPETDSYTYG